MAIGELLELQTEIWYDFILITTEERDDPLYKYKPVDQIPVNILNLPASRMNVIRSNKWMYGQELLCLVIYL